MVKEYTLESLTTLWEDYLQKYGRKKDVREVANSYPDTRSLIVEYREIAQFDPEVAEYLVERPKQAIYAAEEAIRNLLPPNLAAPIHFRVREFPPDLANERVEVRNIRKKHLGKLITVEGLVRKVTEVRPKIQDAVFQCARCGAAIEVPQDGQTLKEPLECYEDQGGCKRSSASTKFTLLTGPGSLRDPFEEPKEGATLRFSEFVDTQKIEIQESPEGLRGGEQPQRLAGFMDDDLAGMITPGDRVTLNGILREQPRSLGGAKSTIFDVFLEIISVERQKHDYEEIPITPEDEERIKMFAAEPEVYAKMNKSIAPSIYGMETEKEALLLQLFGGVSKVLPDGTRIRGDIHLIMVGEPGTAKSQLLRHITQVAPRAIYTSGKSSSAAGLTAAAIKDDLAPGQWTLEAGALVLADKGLAAIDELDKMNPLDRDAMHEAMEQQTISVAKAGITATLQSRTSILGAANPKFGRFDPHQSIIEQIDLPPALLSRFDAIFAIADKPNRDRDFDLATHILRSHHRGETDAKWGYDEAQGGEHEARSIEGDPLMPVIPFDFMRKYIAYAKQRVFPILTDVAMTRIRDYYVDIRKQGEGESAAVPMTARQLEAFVRLAEASARVRLSPTVELSDADRGIRIVEYYLRKIAGEGGVLDIDTITVGVSRAQREVARVLMELIRKLDQGSGVSEDDIIATATAEGIDERKARDMLVKLREQGDLYQPDARHYRATGGFR
jgi:replicative DNA helicase Mcm